MFIGAHASGQEATRLSKGGPNMLLNLGGV